MNKDTIIYSRVSTDDQADNGYGRDHQHEVLKTYCRINGYEIANEYLEDYSAKDFNRPEWKKLESFVKANRKSIKRVLFTKWDRFSRNLEESMRVIRKFRNWGITLNAVEQPLDLSNPNQKVMLSMYLIMPEIENDNISSRTKDGMYRATKEGAFLGTPPFGYKRVRHGKYASLEPNEDAQFVNEIFYKVSLGVVSVEGTRKEFRKKGYKRCKQSFYNMLKNRAYIGKVKVPEYRQEDSYWIEGLHDGIIDISLFNKVQNVLNGKKKIAKPPSKKNDALPLRRFLECELCGGNLTGSVSKGNGGLYGYYHCRGACKNRVSAIKAEKILIDDVLGKINVNNNVLELYKEIIIDAQKSKRGDKGEKIKMVQSKIDATIKIMENTEDKFAKDLMLPEIFNRMMARYEEDLLNLRAELQELKEATELPVKMIDRAVNTLKNIPKLYRTGSFEQKTSLIGLIFPKKLVISENGCRTKERNIVIELLTRVNEASQELDIKKAIKNDGLSSLAPPLGLEPRTL